MPQKPRREQSKDVSSSRKNKDFAALRDAALDLAGRHGWLDITVDEIYTHAGVPRPKTIATSVWLLVADILARLDADVEVDVADRLGGSWRDDLFELLMTRFDLMQSQRAAYSDIMPAALHRSCQSGPVLTRRLIASMHHMIELSHTPVKGIARHAAVTALAGIYLSLLETWRLDDSSDLAKTMAAVDQRLGWFEKLLGNLPSGGQAD